MKHFCFVLAAMLTLTLAGSAQTADPAKILQVTGERLLADLKRMPRYTCVQTITRTYYETRHHSDRPSCSTLIAEHDTRKKKLPVEGWDRLRLEVALVEGGSVYSWVGAPRFTDDTLDKLAGSGPLGSGDFGVFLNGILRHATLNFQGERVVDGARLFEYSYEMPISKSGYRVKVPDGWRVTGYGGTLLLDPQANDLVQLVVRTDELPSASSACQATSEVSYQRAPIHERMVLVPHETKLFTISTTGNESISETSYANCREYTSTVKMIFGGETISASPGPNAVSTPAQETAVPLPAGLRFNAHITTPLDINTAAAGDPIEAVLSTPMRDKNKTAIASVGTRLHGRLRIFKVSTGAFIILEVGLEFESIEIEGRNVPLKAAFPPSHAIFIPGNYYRRFLRPDYSFVGGIFFFNNIHLRPKQLDSEWITVTPGEEKDNKK
ncbi:MAG TPA: hypothetical protein VGK36_12300 [Candidatus Angelobacter sp.]